VSFSSVIFYPYIFNLDLRFKGDALNPNQAFILSSDACVASTTKSEKYKVPAEYGVYVRVATVKCEVSEEIALPLP
jgi:hypothetical protein